MILEKSVVIDDYYLDWESDQKIQIEDAQEKEKIEKLFNELNDNDDVIEVYSNISF
jgi:transcriptional/translational regulatory protein YebC/TACO1